MKFPKKGFFLEKKEKSINCFNIFYWTFLFQKKFAAIFKEE
jgi:hypothetical protein